MKELLFIDPEKEEDGMSGVSGVAKNVQYWGLFEHSWIRKQIINNLYLEKLVEPEPGNFAVAFVLNGEIFVVARGYRAYLISEGRVTWENDPQRELSTAEKLGESSGNFVLLADQTLKFPQKLTCPNLQEENPAAALYCVDFKNSRQAAMPPAAQIFRIGDEKYINRPDRPTKKATREVEQIAKGLVAAKEGTKLQDKVPEGDVVSVQTRLPHQIVAEFIKDPDFKLYGGTAVNKYIPQEQKFYHRGQLPDYDVYTSKPWFYGKKVADLLHEKGFEYVQAKRGTHYGTVKVFVNFWPVLDLTFIPPEHFARIPTQKKEGFNVVAPEYLLIDMYKELSAPLDQPHRWGKVANRQKLLRKWALPKYRVKQCAEFFAEEDVSSELNTILEQIDQFAKERKLLYYGPYAYNVYVRAAGGEHELTIDHYQLITNHFAGSTAQLLQLFGDQDVTVENHVITFKAFNNESNHFFWTDSAGAKHLVAVVTAATMCIPYRYLHKRYIVTVDYLKYELYFQMSLETGTSKNKISCYIRYLDTLQKKYYRANGLDEFDPSPFQRFVTRCRGPYVNQLKNTFRERYSETLERRKDIVALKPVQDKLTLEGIEGRQIRIFPPTKISEQCQRKSREECYYPCEWKDKYMQCFDLPIGGYSAGVPELEKIVPGEKYTV